MATTATPIFPQTIQNWAVKILAADTTTTKTIVRMESNVVDLDCQHDLVNRRRHTALNQNCL